MKIIKTDMETRVKFIYSATIYVSRGDFPSNPAFLSVSGFEIPHFTTVPF